MYKDAPDRLDLQEMCLYLWLPIYIQRDYLCIIYAKLEQITKEGICV